MKIDLHAYNADEQDILGEEAGILKNSRHDKIYHNIVLDKWEQQNQKIKIIKNWFCLFKSYNSF